MSRFQKVTVSWMFCLAALVACGKEENKAHSGVNTPSVGGSSGSVVEPEQPANLDTGEEPAAGLPVFGNWLAADINQGGLSLKAYMRIEADKVSVKLNCSYGGVNRESNVSASAQVTGSTIKVLENAEDTSGDSTCRASLEAKEISYTMPNANTLVMTGENGQTSTITRAE